MERDRPRKADAPGLTGGMRAETMRCIGGENGCMTRTWTIIGVADVAKSLGWYESLLGLPETAPVHDYFGQVLDLDGTVLLCLHSWGEHEHPSLASPDHVQPGNGLLLFFRVEDFDSVLTRARALVGLLTEEPHVSANTGTREFSLRDPDGYYVSISAVSAERAPWPNT
jgi:catechol 2,3-dioxygenase-like lactoylglutathione lyase family enzyme